MKHSATLRYTDTGWQPDDADARELFAKGRPGQLLHVRPLKDRSRKHHRWFRALLAYVAEAHGIHPDRLLAELKYELGKCDPIMLRNGQTVYRFHSTSFEEMDQVEFGEFARPAVDLLCRDYLPAAEASRVLDEAKAMLGIAADG